jgi:diguanylate cyclase (GGDEF)-like protein
MTILDGLTGIHNKRYFLEFLERELAGAHRHRHPLSLVMFDVDHFKKVNDAHGHQAGDMVLAKIGQRVLETVRVEDLLARYGGEEFAIMLRESSDEQAVRCAERVRKAVDTTDFQHAGTPIKVTISVGVATLNDADFGQPDELIACADKYLYRAKNNGRNRIEGKHSSGE